MTDASTRDVLVNRLIRIPTPVMAGILIGLIGLGLVLGSAVGAVLLGSGVLLFAATLVLIWPAIPSTERMLRLAVLLLVIALAVVRLA